MKNVLEFFILSSLFILTSCNNSKSNFGQPLIHERDLDDRGTKNPSETNSSFIDQSFHCKTNTGEAFELQLDHTGNILYQFSNEGGNPLSGQYQIEKGHVTLNLPTWKKNLISKNETRIKNLVINLEFPDVDCYATKHTLGKKIEGFLNCPNIKYLEGISYQSNTFHFFKNGMVLRNVSNESLSDDPSEQFEYTGVYSIENETIILAFGDVREEKILTGTIVDDSSIQINELEPQSGLCQ